MPTTPASQIARYRLGIAARRLGTHNPADFIGSIIDRSFERPIGDPHYGSNALVPGSFPLEQSFSELSNRSLRLAMQPLGANATPLSRRNETSREVRRLINQNYGSKALKWYDHRSETWRGSDIDGRAQFGAWLGTGVDAAGLQQIKAYYEMTPNQIDALPPNLQHACRIAMAMLPGLVPIFTSVACGRRSGAQRVYFYHKGDLRLLDLEPLMHRLGIGHQLPSLLTALGLLLGGRFTLRDGSVIIGLRDTRRGIEMKLEVLLGGFPDPPREMHGLIKMHLAQRPDSQHALENWIQANTPDDYTTPGDISVLGVRVRPQMGARLNIYFRPVGYDRPPSRRNRGLPNHSGVSVS